MSKGHKLRQILEQPGILVLPGVYDCIGAKLVEQLGFEVVFTSGFGISGSTMGMPDVTSQKARVRSPRKVRPKIERPSQRENPGFPVLFGQQVPPRSESSFCH